MVAEPDRAFGLRPVRRQDAAGVVACLNDMEVARNLIKVKPPYTLTDANTWIDRVEADGGENNQTLAVDRDGLIGVVNIVDKHTNPLLSYFLAREHWGRGIMSHAVDAAIKLFFESCGSDTLHSGVLADNAASLKIQRRIGFVEAGSSDIHCLARDCLVRNIETELSRETYSKR